jgi:hypothetical protein
LIPDAGQYCAQTLGQWDTAALDAHQHDLGAGFVALGDFVCDARQGAVDGGGVEDDGFSSEHKKTNRRAVCASSLHCELMSFSLRLGGLAGLP